MSSATLTMRVPGEEIVISPRGRSYSVRRYYDPQTGQFMSVDPLVDQTEAPYEYAGQDPVNDYDLNGAMHGEGDGGQCAGLKGRAFKACVSVQWHMNAYCDAGSPFRYSKACALWWWTFYPGKVKPWMQKWIPHHHFDLVGTLCGASTGGIIVRIVAGAAVGPEEGLAEVGCQILVHVKGDQGPTKG